MPKMISANFYLEEFVLSQTATRKKIDNTPDPATLSNLRRLAQTLEVVRSALGDVPIIISSAYRSKELNKVVGGAKNSAHLIGCAVDFTAPKFGTVLATAKAASKCGIEYDQIIYEYGHWVHLAIPELDIIARSELLSIGDDKKYISGLRTA